VSELVIAREEREEFYILIQIRLTACGIFCRSIMSFVVSQILKIYPHLPRSYDLPNDLISTDVEKTV
jgi:hypothetical protein